MGPADYGSYAFYRNTAAFLVLFSIFGLDSTLNRYTPEFRQKKQGEILHGIMRRSLRLSLISLACLTILSVFLFYILPVYFGFGFEFTPVILAIFIGLLFALTFQGIFKGLVAGLFHQRYQNIVETISTISKLGITILLFFLGFGVEGVLLAVFIAYAVPSLSYYLHSRTEFNSISSNRGKEDIEGFVEKVGASERGIEAKTDVIERSVEKREAVETPRQEKDLHQKKLDPGMWNEIKRYSWFMLLFNAAFMILGHHLDIIMLRLISGAEEAGYYNIAYRFAFINAMVFIGAIDGLLVPAFTSLREGGQDRQRKTLRSALKYTTFFLIPAAVGGVLFSDAIISQFFGDDYSDSTEMLRIYYFTLLLSMAFSWPLRFLLLSMGREKEVLKVYFIYGAMNLAGNFLLIPEMGGIGAVISTGTASWLIALHLIYVVRKEGLLDFPVKFAIKSCVSSGISIFIFIPLLPFISNILILAGCYLLFAFLYCSIFYAFKGITREEITKLRELISADRRG